MKKSIIVVAIIILSAGILPSCTKNAEVKPTATFEKSTVANKKDIGTAD